VIEPNYELYSNLPRRVMSILGKFCPDIEYYSFDEAFSSLEGFTGRDLATYMTNIRKSIKQWTGLTVAIDFAQTKTLAKIANYIAKKENHDAHLRFSR
jgi:DNA polymerase V